MADEDVQGELERLRAENERLRRAGGRASAQGERQGGVGLRLRRSVTLYKEQGQPAMTDEIRAFIREHDAEPRRE
jgi:hypothetical protein